MIAQNDNSADLTLYSRLVLWILVLPLLLIAGIQLFVLSSQTETYFAWTFASPLPAAFLGAGYWAAMLHTYTGLNSNRWAYVRTSIPPAVTATTLLLITTFLHLDKFHLHSPLLITRFVTWVWIAVYIVAPFSLILAWIIQTRLSRGANKSQNPLPTWLRLGHLLLAIFGLLNGIALFFGPVFMSSLWPWAVTPLAARAVSSWILAFGAASIAIIVENDIKNSSGTSASLFVFCLLELIAVARYVSLIDWGKALAIPYLLFLLLGLFMTGAHLWLNNNKLA